MSDIVFKDRKIIEFIDKIKSKFTGINKLEKTYVDSLSAIVFADVIRHFQDEKGPDGKWQAWSPSYAEVMAKNGKGGNKILQDTGRLRSSFVPTNWRKTRKGPLWFNDAKTKSGFPYAFAHDNDERPRKTLPRRAYMWLSKDAMLKVSKITLGYMLRGVK